MKQTVILRFEGNENSNKILGIQLHPEVTRK